MAVLPVVIPLLTAALALVFLKRPLAARGITLAGATSLLIACAVLFDEVWDHGIVVLSLGNWGAPFGIALVVDHLSALMLLITAVTGLAVTFYSFGSISENLERGGYYPLIQMLLVGVNGAFVTGDLFNLYVWFEVMLIASFVLLTLGGSKAQLRGGVQYVLINLLSSACFLLAIALTYGLTGSLNMADVAGRLSAVDAPGLVTAVALLFMVAFGIKAAVFPLFFWLPVSYHTPPAAVGALFAGLLTKVGVYALMRAFTLLFVGDIGFTHEILLFVAALTMVTGVLGAAAQYDIKKILGFHIVSQIGYMVMGLALLSRLALAGAVFYIAHHIIVKANLYLIGGVMEKIAGSTDLKKIGGLYRARPFLALLFLVPAFSLAGFPPLSGFWAKMIVIKASLHQQEYLIAFVALVVSALTIFSMTKIWALGFWKPHPEGEEALVDRPIGMMLAPIAWLAVLTIIIGLNPQPIYELADRAAFELLNRDAYIEAVLGEREHHLSPTPSTEPATPRPAQVSLGEVTR